MSKLQNSEFISIIWTVQRSVLIFLAHLCRVSCYIYSSWYDHYKIDAAQTTHAVEQFKPETWDLLKDAIVLLSNS